MDNQEQVVQKILLLAQEEASNPYRFKPLENDPETFAREILGVDLWSRQVEIMEATLKHRRIAIRSGHGIGKTFTMAALTLWWLYARQGRVVTTAPTKENVEQVLWFEINEMAKNARVPLPGQSFLTERKVTDTWSAIGITAKEDDAFRGRHHPRLLVLVDEATGVSEAIHLAIASLATADENVIVMIGNPTSTSGTFFEAFRGNVWHKIHVSCLDHPNVIADKQIIPGAVNRAWVEERRQLWGTNHPLWYSRVLGEFPKISTRGVIPLGWVERAQNEEKRQSALEEAKSARIPRVAGLDVARYGDNNCVLIIRRGDAIEDISSWHHTSLTETARRAEKAIDEWQLKTLVVDSAGIGAGVVDILMDKRLPVIAYNGGHRAFTPGFFSNRRSELWWHLRSRLEHQRLWLPPGYDTTLVRDLIAPEYNINQSGRLQVETKEKLLERGVPSPDWADALVECFAMDEDPEAFIQQGPDPRQQDTTTMFEPLDPEDDVFHNLPHGF